MNLSEQYEKMRRQRGPGYRPHTRHIDRDGWARYTNRLFLEPSPYLLQHAHNPVDWYPWGDEAFETARRKNRPVLLSVGYSTCHWCHVMEEESFEDEEIAGVINDNYVAIKVDREERPDVDAVYMAAVQALTGGGGWPMTVWLTPDKKPFYAGTYFPARDGDRGGSVGFLTLLQKISESFAGRRDIVEKTSEQLTSAVRRMVRPETGSGLPGDDILQQAVYTFRNRFDHLEGGLQGAPKFPSTLSSRLLFRFERRNPGAGVLDMARLSLDKMADGGIYDHVGGGFHRYSTDARWLVPHFEKMLYDNALLVMDYIEGYQVFGDERYRRVAGETLDYVRHDMTSPEGAFYAATDADSLTPEGRREEGYFFTWTPEELEAVLGKELASVARAYYAVGPAPNFEGRHILHRQASVEAVAERLGISEKKLVEAVVEIRTRLKAAREVRPSPGRDEKVLVAWNGLMISAFARAGFTLHHDAYIRSAVDAAGFIVDHMQVEGRLYRSYQEGRIRHLAYLDDYAFFTASLLDLYEATGDLGWFARARELENVLAEHYEDREAGGFFMTGDNQETLIAREKPNFDGAMPSGNAVAVMNLLRLAAFTSDPSYTARADKAFKSLSGLLAANPTGFAALLTALDFRLDQPREIIIVTPEGRPDLAEPFLGVLRKQFTPNRVLTVVEDGKKRNAVEAAVPIVRNRPLLEGKATAYVCVGNACKLPTTDPKAFGGQLKP
ncbi:MAG: thioredoxin domain-containing protein [Deltaproteobacteria bacterium]|nr:thioredoxin domain-containing protein [Deltaproteobacteria bacterium]